MTDFYDWLTAADTGLTADRLAESFRLSQQELRRATEALAPAFTQALRGAMSDPGAITALAASFAPFADPRLTGGGAPPAAGLAQALAEQLFGSSERTASLARRASLTSGIAPDILQKLIASLSVLTMETVMRMMVANVARNQPPLPTAGSYGAAIAESMRRGANAVDALSRPSEDFAPRSAGSPMTGGIDLQAMFRDALTGRLPWLPPAGEARAPARRRAPDTAAPPLPAPAFDAFMPFAAMMSAFARGMGVAEAETTPPAPAPQAPRAQAPVPGRGGEKDAAAAGPEAAFGALWESGRRMQDDYVREMTALFSRYAPATRPNGEGQEP